MPEWWNYDPETGGVIAGAATEYVGPVVTIAAEPPLIVVPGAIPVLSLQPATPAQNGYLSAADCQKLDSIEMGATVNMPDAWLLDRSHHTGTQAASTITGFERSWWLPSPQPGDKVAPLWLPWSRTVSQVRSIRDGGTSVLFTLKHASSFLSAGTEIKTGGILCNQGGSGVLTETFDSPTVGSGDLIWLEIVTVSGPVANLLVTARF